MNTVDILFSLQKYWDANRPEGLTTVYPGTAIDVSTQTEWAEFWISQIHDTPKRESSPLAFFFSIDIHFFSRSSNTRAISTRVDAARIAFRPTSISVNSVDEPELQIGQLRFREPVIRDLSRSETLENHISLQHFVMSLQANALETLN